MSRASREQALEATGAALPLDEGVALDDNAAVRSADAPGSTVRSMSEAMLGGMLSVLGPNLGWLVPAAIALAVIVFPMPRRGPNSSARDAWRLFKYTPRQTVLTRAGGRCEGAAFIAWGRCSDPAVQVDHVFPWSRGGPTVVSNGQALCAGHNRSKGAMTPPWWYVLSLERRRRSYFPQGADVRVFAVMSSEDAAARTTTVAARSRARAGR